MRTIKEIKADIVYWKTELENSVAASKMPEFTPGQFDSQIQSFESRINYFESELSQAIISEISLDRLEQICDAEKDGRLVTLPCKVGDTVWVIIDGKVWPEYVGSFCIRHGGADFFIHNIGVDNEPEFKAYATINDFGKTVFLTRAEAEKALGKEQNDGK